MLITPSVSNRTAGTIAPEGANDARIIVPDAAFLFVAFPIVSPDVSFLRLPPFPYSTRENNVKISDGFDEMGGFEKDPQGNSPRTLEMIS